MRSSKWWLLLLVAAILGALAWRLGLLPVPGEGARGDDASAPAPLGTGSPEAVPAADAEAARLAGRAGKAAGPADPLRATLPEGTPRLQGVVVDRAGRGVPGARVLSIPDTAAKTFLPTEVGGEAFPGFEAIADAQGRFVVGLSKASTNHGLVVTAEGFAPGVKRDVGAGPDVRVVLDRAGALVGTVMNAEGEPVANATVFAMTLLDVMRMERQATTDPTGAYRIEGWVVSKAASAGWWPTYARVEAEGYAPLFLDQVPAAEPGGEVRRDFVLVRGAVVSGRVLEADTEKPLAGVPVVLWSEEGRMHLRRGMDQGASVAMPWGPRRLAQAVSGPDGSFRFEHVPANGFHRIGSQTGGRQGTLLGYVAAWMTGRAVAREEVPALADGGTLEVTLRLGPAGGVAGRVVDVGGKPVAAVSVYPRLAPGATMAWVPKEVVPDAPAAWAEPTGADGRFRLTGIPLPPGDGMDLLVEARRRRESDGMGGRREPDGSATIRLVPGTVVEAPDLVLGEGKAEPGADVTGIPIRVEDDRGQPVVGATVSWAVNSGQSQRTDAEGRARFHVMRLRPGQTVPPLQLVARARGFAPTPFSVPWTQADPEPVVVRLLRAHRLAGIVRQADGTPAAGASVRVANGTVPVEEAFPEGTPDFMLGQNAPKPGGPALVHYGMAVAGDDGSFVLEDLPEGPYTVVASTPRRGAVASPFDVKPLRDLRPGVPTDAGALDLRLPVDDSPAPGSLEGTVGDATTGRPAMRFTVRTEGTAPGPRRVGSNMVFAPLGPQIEVVAPGRFAAPKVPPGTYVLLVEAEGFRRVRVPNVEVRSGERTVVPRVSLERGCVLSGRVTAPPGADLSTLVLSFVHLEDDTLSVTIPLDSKGRYARGGFQGGRWLLRVMPAQMPIPGQDSIWACEDGGFLSIPDGAATATRDLTIVPGARMYLELSDERLPPSRMMGEAATPEQTAFGAATSLRVTAPDGSVLLDRKDVTRGWGPWSWHSVKPGRYLVRVTFPGGEISEQAVDAEVGKDARLPAPQK